MSKQGTIILAVLFAGSTACQTADPISPVSGDDMAAELSGRPGGPDRTSGGGFLDFGGGLLVQSSFTAVRKGPGLEAGGQFRFSVELGGELIEFHGEVSCLAVDAEEGRAWIGGVVTRNRSTHPDWMTDINEPGDDVWFRVLDSGEGAGAEPDRSTFLGFEGAAGIITSEEYCEAQIWPDNNARTVPQASGNIQVTG